MESVARGTLRKMPAEHADPISYCLRIGTEEVPMNELLERRIGFQYRGEIFCQQCNRKTKTSFNQGYCYPCFQSLASCDRCIMSPELCHYDEGTCREPEWGEEFCMQPHLVYLANSSGIKVGITRPSQVPTRWIDQGAVQALPVMRVATRQQSGLVEVVFKQEVSDRTQWQRMLKSAGEALDLATIRDELLDKLKGDIGNLQERFGIQAIQYDTGAEPFQLNYPVTQYPDKIKSINLERQPLVEGTLLGIKGQYLILDCGVLNIRKFTSYEVEFFS